LKNVISLLTEARLKITSRWSPHDLVLFALNQVVYLPGMSHGWGGWPPVSHRERTYSIPEQSAWVLSWATRNKGRLMY